MSPSAHLTILWGATPIGSVHIAPGQSVGIDDGGVITRASDRDSVALLVQMHARGATVSRPGGAARGAPSRRWIPTGGDVQLAIAAPSALPVYRQRMAWEPAPVTLRIAVTAETPRSLRRPVFAARLWGAITSVAVHAVALVIAGLEMPPLTPFSPDAFASEPFAVTSFHVDADYVEPYQDGPREDLGSAPAVCSASQPIGHSVAVQGPSDNDDPHLSNYHEPWHDFMLGTPRHRMPSDEAAPNDLWGRDDVLGVDPFSATGTVRGNVRRPSGATCFGPPPETWSCTGRDESPEPEPVTSESLGLIGIGEVPPPPQPASRRRPEHVVAGPIAVDANVPRWLFASAVRDALVDDARACYERALADDPAFPEWLGGAPLGGRLDVVVKVRGEAVSVKLEPKGNLARSPAFLCCVEHMHDSITDALPNGTRATGRYSITFGRPEPASS